MIPARIQYLILGFLIGALIDSVVVSTATLAHIAAGLVGFLAAFLFLRRTQQ
jgi:hypothetical protein